MPLIKKQSREELKKIRQKKKISFFLENFLKEFPENEISFGEIRDSLGGRAFSGLMLIFVLPNLIPLPIPGISTILGTPLIILSFQFMKGRKSPWFPKWLKNKKIKKSKLQSSLNYIIPYIKKCEIIFSPKLTFLVEYPMERVLAGFCMIASIIMALPIPLANWLPALSIFIISLSILERDGLLAIIGISAFSGAIFLTYTIIFTIFKGGLFFIEQIFF